MLDKIYGKENLDAMQEGVSTSEPLCYNTECHRVYYKHGREIRQSFLCAGSETLCRPQNQHFCKALPGRHKLFFDDVAPEVTKAYLAKRALWRLRCKRANASDQRLGNSTESSHAEVAWQVRLEESRVFWRRYQA